MTVEDHFEEQYKAGTTPWDIGKPDFNLVQTVTALPVAPSKALEIGCGTGDNAIWLSQQNFTVVGVDSSEIAIKKARQKAATAKVTCTFAVLNILKGHVDGTPFGFAFDRGCFHTVDSPKQRRIFAKQVYAVLENNGVWLSLIGNADEKRVGEGPPRLSAKEIVTAVEPDFEILSLVSGHFEAKLPFQPRSWICLMRKRQAA